MKLKKKIKNSVRYNICQVSLPGNISIIKTNLLNFNKFYKKTNFFIICPKKDKIKFKKELTNSFCEIIDEEKVLSYKKFKTISNKYLNQTIYFRKIQKRLKWYYQQTLKIVFVLEFLKKYKKPIVIWDADTIILKKIIFFNKNLSIKYGTTSEFHKAYYKTNKIILKKLPKYFISSLAQFIAITPEEGKFLIKKLKKFKNKKGSTGAWVSNIIFQSVVSAHKEYNGSMFSEYELIGHSNLLKDFKAQKLISGIRENLNGKLTSFQEILLKVFNYKYVAYEHTHPNKESLNMLSRKQTWLAFFKLLIRKTSNKLFRGLKHNLKTLFI